jgi:uncharacterized membrane protein/protein-disulfide isomerase
MSTLSRKLLLGFALLGLAAASTSSYVHYELLTQPNYSSFCDVNTTVSCAEAYLSRYGSLWGVPVALAGVVFFALVALLAGVAGRPTSSVKEAAPGYIFALSTVGLAFVLYLGWASYLQLKVFCMLCAVTYVSVIAIFIVSGGATTVPMTTLPRRAAKDLRTLVSTPFPLVLALLFVVAASVGIVKFPHEGATTAQAAENTYPPLTDEQRAQLEKWWDVQPKVDLPIPADGADVVIVKFSDYMCPSCRQTYDAFKEIIQRRTADGKVRFVLKHYPLEPECNASVPGGNHIASCEAAAAVIMARSKGTADKLEEWIFANQPTLSPAVVKQAAKDVGKIDDFDAQYARVLQEVRTDASLGALVQVASTPTFFINGRRIVGGMTPQYFEGLIDLALKKGK